MYGPKHLEVKTDKTDIQTFYINSSLPHMPMPPLTSETL